MECGDPRSCRKRSLRPPPRAGRQQVDAELHENPLGVQQLPKVQRFIDDKAGALMRFR
jgi:hypothetical protein